jgi:hypothetical protein
MTQLCVSVIHISAFDDILHHHVVNILMHFSADRWLADILHWAGGEGGGPTTTSLTSIP